MGRSPLVLALTFCCGACSLALEFGAEQQLAPFFGDGVNVWAVLIGLLLLCLSTGYLLGGRLADRRPLSAGFYLLVAGAGLWVAAIPLVSSGVLTAALRLFAGVGGGAVPATLMAAVLLYAVPTAAFGCASPYAIRLLLRDVEWGGQTAGQVYALTTAGALVGTLVPVFITIPYVGTAQTLSGAGLLLVLLTAVAAVGELLNRRSAGPQRGTVQLP